VKIVDQNQVILFIKGGYSIIPEPVWILLRGWLKSKTMSFRGSLRPRNLFEF